MQCPFCAEEVRDDASICRCCGNDLKIPEFLLTENAELKERGQRCNASWNPFTTSSPRPTPLALAPEFFNGMPFLS